MKTTLCALFITTSVASALAKPSVTLFRKFQIGSAKNKVCVAKENDSAYGPQGIFWKSTEEMLLLDTCNHRLLEIFNGKQIPFSGVDFSSDLFVSERSIVLLGNISQKILLLDRTGKFRSCILNTSTEPIQTSLLVSGEKEVHLNKNASAESFPIGKQSSSGCSEALGEPVPDTTSSFIYKNKFGSVKIEGTGGTHVLRVKKDRARLEAIEVSYASSRQREFQFLGFDESASFYVIRYEFEARQPMTTFLDRWSKSGQKVDSILLNPYGIFGPKVLETTRTFTLAHDGTVYALVPTLKDVRVLKINF